MRRRRGPPFEDHGVAAPLYSPADLPVGARRRRMIALFTKRATPIPLQRDDDERTTSDEPAAGASDACTDATDTGSSPADDGSLSA